MKKFLKKLGEIAAMALLPVLIEAVIEALGDLKKKVENEIETK